MEKHKSPSAAKLYSSNIMRAKKLWNLLRFALIMIRKGTTLMSKRKLIVDMNLMMKRGKLLRKTLGNLIMSPFHHHHHSKNGKYGSAGHATGFGIGHYEFSCTNTPNNNNHVSKFHIAKKKRNKQDHYFPCINLRPPAHADHDYEDFDDEEDEQQQHNIIVTELGAPQLPKINQYYYSPKHSYSSTTTSDHDAPPVAAAGENKLIINPLVALPFSIKMISNYSSEDEEDNYDYDYDEEEDYYDDNDINNNDILIDDVYDNDEQQVDVAAEDFIRRFYEQLRVQST